MFSFHRAFLEWIGTILPGEMSALRDGKARNTAGKWLLFPILIVSAKPWQCQEGDSSADTQLLGLQQEHIGLPTNPWLVHYHTALSTGIPRAAPKHPLLSCISLLLTAALQQMKSAPSCWADLSLISRARVFLAFKEQQHKLVPEPVIHGTAVPQEGQHTKDTHNQFLLLRNVSLLESSSATGSPLALAVCSGQGKSWSKVMQSDTNTEVWVQGSSWCQQYG